MSDTHGARREVMLPQGDVLIHTGDFTKLGEAGTVQDLDAFFKEAKQTKNSNGFEQVICIAGNHDITFHDEFY
jgi:3',5'-cyclic AMP phosphodiesterase CpdA